MYITRLIPNPLYITRLIPNPLYITRLIHNPTRLIPLILFCYCRYVDHLKIIAEDFRQCLLSLNVKANKPVIPEATMNLIFLNIGEIFNLNKQLMTDLEQRMNEW